MNAVSYVYYTANTVDVLRNVNFLNNTFVDCGMIDFDKGATNNTWANNIFRKGSGNIFEGSAAGVSWAGNMYSGTLGISILSGMTNNDPKLVRNSDGYYGLSSSSPAIDASSANYSPILDIAGVDDDPSLLLDISGRSRPVSATLKDVGCSEYNAAGTITNRPLRLSDVGPSYLGGPATSVTKDHDKAAPENMPSGFQLDEAYPNPFNPATTIRFHILTTEHISLRIFDQLGREVAKLVDGRTLSGQYQVQWNGSQHPSGVYFCRLQTEQRIETIKLLLLK